jgi:hypothetical protein
MSTKKGKAKNIVTKSEIVTSDSAITINMNDTPLPVEWDITYPIAIDRVIKQLRSDDELFSAYKANISIFVYDAIVRSKKKKGSELNYEEILEACNIGAKDFLEVMTK